MMLCFEKKQQPKSTKKKLAGSQIYKGGFELMQARVAELFLWLKMVIFSVAELVACAHSNDQFLRGLFQQR